MSRLDTTLPRRNLVDAVPRELALKVLFSPDLSFVGQFRRLATRGLALGRDGDDTLSSWMLPDPMASRHHATIHWDEPRGRFLLQDEDSRNGTQLNGQTISRECLAAADLLRVGDSLFELIELEPAQSASHGEPWASPPESLLAGGSDTLRTLLSELSQVAPTQLSTLIQGETGCGKDVIAREIHRLSKRPGAYVALNCATIVESLVESELFGHKRGAFSGATEDRKGVLEQAFQGTLLLDEIGELPSASQAKFLRMLEERQVRPVGASRPIDIDVRFLFATNRVLLDEVNAGRFRADLYARINQWHIQVPPLRARRGDILPIWLHSLSPSSELELSADAFEALALHAWPFNVRELIALVRKLEVRLPQGATVERHHLKAELALAPASNGNARESEPSPALPLPGQEPTRQELERLLNHFEGSVSDAARHLQRGRTQLYRWLKKHDIDPSLHR